jgi:hypothetical protein
MGDGLQGGVIKLVQRSDGAIAAIGNLNSYDGVELNNSIAILMPLEEVETDTETEATTTSVAATVSSSGFAVGGSGGGGGSSAVTTVVLPLATSTVGTVLGVQTILGCNPGNLFSVISGVSCTGSAGLSATTISPATHVNMPTRNIALGANGNDVKILQQYLNAKGFMVSSAGAGSPGSESTYFGLKTKAALAKFQKNAGISPAVGFFGPITRAYIISH